MGIAQRAKMLRASRHSASIRTFDPPVTIKCDGPPIFRSQAARDAACLFDVNPSILSWHCMPLSLDYGGGIHVPDFGILDEDGTRLLVDAPDRVMPPTPPKLKSSRLGKGTDIDVWSPMKSTMVRVFRMPKTCCGMAAPCWHSVTVCGCSPSSMSTAT